MVRLLLNIIIFLTITATSFAAEFKASVSKTEFAKGENIEISYILSGARTSKHPDVSKYNEAGFTMIRQHKTIKSNFINGRQEHYIKWNLTFKTSLVGKATLPSASLDTNKGTLKSKPISITISNKPKKNSLIDKQVIVTNKINKKYPLVNENLIYKTTITRYINIHKAEVIAPESKDALINLLEEPHSVQTTINGKNAIVTNYSYLVTPIKTGKITITAPYLKGLVASNQNADPYVDLNNMFRFSNFRKYDNFVISGKDLVLNVSNKKYHDDNWLPLNGLTLKSDQQKISEVNVGDPISFSINLEGHNLIGDQLPKLSFPESDQYKIYSDQADSNTRFNRKNKIVTGSKKFNFTIIPIQPGEINIPELEIAWYDLKSKKKQYVRSKSLSFKAISNSAKNTSFLSGDFNQEKNKIPKLTKPKLEPNNNNVFYKFSLLLNIFLLISLGLALYYIKKVKSPIAKQEKEKSKKTVEISKSLGKVKSAEGMQKFCIKYFKERYDFTSNNLADISDELSRYNESQAKKFAVFFKYIESCIYGGKKFIASNSRKDLKKLLNKLPRKLAKKAKKPKKLKLNP